MSPLMQTAFDDLIDDMHDELPDYNTPAGKQERERLKRAWIEGARNAIEVAQQLIEGELAMGRPPL